MCMLKQILRKKELSAVQKLSLREEQNAIILANPLTQGIQTFVDHRVNAVLQSFEEKGIHQVNRPYVSFSELDIVYVAVGTPESREFVEKSMHKLADRHKPYIQFVDLTHANSVQEILSTVDQYRGQLLTLIPRQLNDSGVYERLLNEFPHNNSIILHDEITKEV